VPHSASGLNFFSIEINSTFVMYNIKATKKKIELLLVFQTVTGAPNCSGLT